MAHYTTTIKSLMANNFNFGLDSYPIFDENYRETLNSNILNHYYENEIGFETANLFKFYLNQKMNEIMPYYNELYNVQKKLIDENLLLNNVNMTESLSGNNSNISVTNSNTSSSSQSSSSNSGSSTNRNLFQDTPQGAISSQNIDDNSIYATNITLDKNTTSNSITDNSSNSGSSTNRTDDTATNSYLKTIVGNNGGKFNIDILNDIRNNLMNIDLLIINELYDLFMQIF